MGVTLESILNDPAIKNIPFEELEMGEAIGQGAAGVVAKGVWNGRDVALKQLIVGLADFDAKALDDFLVEIKLMSALRYKYVVEFLGVSLRNEKELFLVTELMHKGNLRQLLDKKG